MTLTESNTRKAVLHLMHKVAQSKVDGAQQVLKALTDARQLSPLQIDAAEAALKPLKQEADTAWNAYMASFKGVEVVAEVQVVTPTALVTA